MCLSLDDYQSTISRYRKRLIYLKNVITNQNTIESQKPKRREHKHKRKSSNHKKKNEQKRNIESTGKQSLK